MSSDIEIVGCDDGKNGRSCFFHEVYDKHIQVDNVIVFCWEVISIHDKLEETINVYVIRDGTQPCHIGFLPEKLLKNKMTYINKIAIVVYDLRKSEGHKIEESHYKLRRCKKAGCYMK